MNQNHEQQHAAAVASSSKLSRALIKLFSLPKSLYFNFKCLPFKSALKMPFLTSYRVKITKARRNIVVFNCKPNRFMIRVGFDGSEGVVSRKGCICFEKGTVIFKGRALFCEGISLRSSGTLSFGENFITNKNCTIWCSMRIEFGRDVGLGWNSYIRDSDGDGHRIWINNELNPTHKEIIIGNHNWIGSEVHMLKGSGIGSDCVVGYKSLLTKRFTEDSVIIAGHPARIIHHNIRFIL